MVTHANRPGEHGAGTDNSYSGQCKDAIDREAKARVRRSIACMSGSRHEIGTQFVDALPSYRRNRHDIGPLKNRPGNFCSDMGGDFRKVLGCCEIGFRQRDGTSLNSEKIENCQMFDCLRFYTVIGGDGKKCKINSARTS